MRTLAVLGAVLGLLFGAAAPSSADEAADLKALTDKVIQAHGGPEKLADISSATLKFKATRATGQTTDWEYTLQPPHQVRVHITEAGKDRRIVLIDQSEGKSHEGARSETLDQETKARYLETLHRMKLDLMLGALADKELKLALLGPSKVGNQDALGITVSSPGHQDVRMFFGKNDGELLKTEGTVREPGTGKLVTQEGFFSNYKTVEGHRRPMTINFVRDGKPWSRIDITQLTFHSYKHPDDHFKKP